MSTKVENDLFDLSGFESLSELMDANSVVDSIGQEPDEQIMEIPEQEVEQEQEPKVEDQVEETEEVQPEPNRDILKPYAKLLVDEGILPNIDLEKFDGTTEGLLRAQSDYMAQSIEEHIKQYRDSLDPRLKWLEENYDAGVPLEELLAIDRENLRVESIKADEIEDNVKLQKDIVRDYFRKATDFSDSHIEKYISRIDGSGDLEDEAKDFYVKLKDINKAYEETARQEAQQRQAQYQKMQEDSLRNFKSTLEKTSEIIPGVSITNKTRDDIFKTLTTPIGYDENGVPYNEISIARSKDPMGFEIKLAYLWKVTNGFSKWDSVVASGKKEAFKEFEQAASSIDVGSKGATSRVATKSNVSDNEFLKQLEEYNNYLKKNNF